MLLQPAACLHSRVLLPHQHCQFFHRTALSLVFAHPCALSFTLLYFCSASAEPAVNLKSNAPSRVTCMIRSCLAFTGQMCQERRRCWQWLDKQGRAWGGAKCLVPGWKNKEASAYNTSGRTRGWETKARGQLNNGRAARSAKPGSGESMAVLLGIYSLRGSTRDGARVPLA